MNIISLIQPQELGPDFYLDQGVWKVNFPPIIPPPPPISSDERNIIKSIDDGMYVDQRNRLAYAVVQDNQAQKIQLWQFHADEVFNIETATMVSEIDMLTMNGQFDDVAINEGVITFTDVQSGSTLTLNINELQRVGSIKSTNTVTVTETEGILRLSAKLDPKANNLLEIADGGLQVAPDKVEQIFNEELAKRDIFTQTIFPDENVGHQHVIGDQITSIPKVMLTNTVGDVIALVNDPNALEMANPYVYPSKVDIKNSQMIDGLQNSNTVANFSMVVDGVSYFASKPDLLVEDLSIIPGPVISIILDSSGSLRVMVQPTNDESLRKPITIVLSPSETQKPFSNRFLGIFRGAKVLANGDLEFVLLPGAST